MYNTQVSLTYYDDSILFLETDELLETEKDFIRNVVYRQEFLDIFDLDDFEENNTIKELYKKLENCKELIECMKMVSIKTIKEDNSELGLSILFSYQYMHLTHLCVSDYLNTRHLNLINLNKLKKEIEIN
jgi:hypothetical protein